MNAAKSPYRNIWTGKFDYQKAIDDILISEGINNPNSKWLVANKKNIEATNNLLPNDISLNKGAINIDGFEYKTGLNIGYGDSRGKKYNIALITKKAIKNKAEFVLTDIIRHENIHQLQTLNNSTMSIQQREMAAYVTNMLNPATSTTASKAMQMLIQQYGFNNHDIRNFIINHGPFY